jgi:hypothetical protein
LADASVAHASQQESPQPALFAEEDSGDSQKTRVTHSESSSKLIVPPIASESTEAALNSTNDMAVRENIQPKSSPRSQSSTRLNSALIPIPITSEINIQPKESIDKLTEILGTDPPSAASQKARRDSAINASTEARALLYLIAQISSPDQLAQLKEIAPVSFAINPVAASSNAKKLAQVGIYTDTRTGHLLMRQTLNELQRIGIEAWVSRSGLDAQP